MSQELDRWVGRMAAARADYRLPPGAGALADTLVSSALALLFPHFQPRHHPDARSIRGEIRLLDTTIRQFLSGIGYDEDGITDSFIEQLPAIHDALVMDAAATYEADPAARSVDEVILAYPGFYAIACHRLAHHLWTGEVPLLPRLVSESAHRVTGIDIHPGATIGRALSIDHGTGIVVGETSVIGDRVRLYQGVTLGALSVKKELARQRRHPTIEDDVVIYANATILGGRTVVGHSSIIGGNVWLTHSVPPHSVVTNVVVCEHHNNGPETPLEPMP
jgi:serine O-acetyltransferase